MKKKNSVLKGVLFFCLFVMLSYAGGYLIGLLLGKGEGNPDIRTFLENLFPIIGHFFPTLFVILGCYNLGFSLGSYLACRKMQKSIETDPDNEALFDKLERKLSRASHTISVLNIAELVFGFVFLYELLVLPSQKGDTYEIIIRVAGILVFVLNAFLMILIPSKLFEIEKALNPEKKGNLFDFDFEKKYMASCDERERMIAYQAGYQAYRSVNIVCFILLAVSLILTFLMKNPISIIFTGIILFVNNVSYANRVKKLDEGF